MAVEPLRIDKGARMLLGMVHVQALPGTPGSKLNIDQILQRAIQDARILTDAGFHGVILENMHDVPYLHGRHSPETIACMTMAAHAVSTVLDKHMMLGVQILSGGNHEALAVLQAAGFPGKSGNSENPKRSRANSHTPPSGQRFIRCENFVFSHVADEGLLPKAEAGELLRYRKNIGADGFGPGGPHSRIDIFADVKKKHASHALTADISIRQAAEAAAFFGADALIVTGTATAMPTDPEDVRAVAEATSLPVLVGSGVTPDNAQPLFEYADALIVGSWIKYQGRWANDVDPKRAHALIRAAGLRRRN